MRIVYSPLDCLKIARQNPAPHRGLLRRRLRDDLPGQRDGGVAGQATAGFSNFAVLVSHVLVPPAMTAILSSPANRVQGFLAAGHVCTVDRATRSTSRWPSDFGFRSWSPASSRWICWRGFIVASRCWRKAATASTTNTPGSSGREGNPAARQLIDEVFEVSDRKWRGIGTIPQSGLRLRPGVCRFRRRTALRDQRAGSPRIDRVHQRADPARHSQAARLPGLWQDLHARASLGGDHGFVRGGVRRLLSFWPSPGTTGRRAGHARARS